MNDLALKWPEGKSKAWRAVADYARYDEHADGCDEIESQRLYDAAEAAFDELWTIARNSVVCEKCGLDEKMAKREAEGVIGCVGERIANARAELESLVAGAVSRKVAWPMIDAAIAKLMIEVRMGNP